MRKIFLYIIMGFLFICCNYESKVKGNMKTPEAITITNGIKEDWEYGTEYFYHAKKGGDTINICIDLFESPDRNNMIIAFQNHWKTVSSSDTSIVSEMVFNGGYKRTTYKEQMHLIDLFFKKIAQERDIRKLTNIEYPLLPSGELNVEISQMMMKSPDKDIADAIKESSLYEMVNKFLKAYSLEIDKVFVDKYAFVNKNSFQSENVMDSICSLHNINEFIDCSVDFRIKRQN